MVAPISSCEILILGGLSLSDQEHGDARFGNYYLHEAFYYKTCEDVFLLNTETLQLSELETDGWSPEDFDYDLHWNVQAQMVRQGRILAFIKSYEGRYDKNFVSETSEEATCVY